ncbi:MAG: ribonuclease P protein component [Steroidobacteraceae bacterium]
MPTFTPAQRLVHKAQFDAVYQQGSKLGDSCFLILIKPNELKTTRLGLSVSARTVGNAVNRNRIKRVIRNSFRLSAHQLPSVDIVVNTRPGARDTINSVLAERLAQHWKNVVKRCAAP